MKQDNKIHLCFLCCVISCVISILFLLISTREIQDVKQENKCLSDVISYYNQKIDNQNETIENYKQYVDDISRCIVDGEW